jgi:hypothetical protein
MKIPRTWKASALLAMSVGLYFALAQYKSAPMPELTHAELCFESREPEQPESCKTIIQWNGELANR